MQNRLSSQLLDRVLLILDTVAESVDGTTLSEIAAKTGLSVATCHRLLGAMTERGMLFRAEDRRFVFGARIGFYRLQAEVGPSLRRRMAPALRRLNSQFRETIMLFAREGTRSVCIDRIDGDTFIETLTGKIGGTVPLGIGAGSIMILASLPDDEREAIIAANSDEYGRFRNVTPDSVRLQCETAREAGYAFDVGEVIIGVSGVSIPIYDHTTRVIGAFGFTLLTERATAEHVLGCVEALRDEIRSLQRRQFL